MNNATKARLAVLCAPLLVLSLGGCSHADHFPVVPTHTVPSPNAFDFYVKAANGAYSDLKQGSVASKLPPNADYAKLKDFTPQQKALLLRTIAPDLAVLRQGFAYPYMNPPIRSWDTPMMYYPRFRMLARLLALDGDARAASGDWDGAANSYVDIIQMAVAIPNGSTSLGLVVGNASERIGRIHFTRVISHLTNAQAITLQNRIARIESQRAPIANAFIEDKYATQASLLTYYKKLDWASAISDDQIKDMGVTGGGNIGDVLTLSLNVLGKQKLFDQSTNYHDAIIQKVMSPYPLKVPVKHVAVDPITTFQDSVFSLDPFTTCTTVQVHYVDAQTQNRMLLTALALRRYYLAKGTYPQSLSALIPTYLTKIPDDPFAISGLLKYKKLGATYLLYSIGPDGKDNHGTPITDHGTPPKPWVYDTSVGDVVAGVNP